MLKKKTEYPHTAAFLCKQFLLSKRSLNPIYELTPTSIAILRYICDAIDLNFKKLKSFSSGYLGQDQIGKYCHITTKRARPHIHKLIKKKLLTYDEKKHSFYIGNALRAMAALSLTRDETSLVVRRGTKRPFGKKGDETSPICKVPEILPDKQQPTASKKPRAEKLQSSKQIMSDIYKTLGVRK